MEKDEYQKYEFCKDVECTALEHGVCNAYVCHKTAKHFHHRRGYAGVVQEVGRL